MKPAPFDHVHATDVAQAVALLEKAEGTARVLAGGHSLLPLLAMRRSTPSLLVDLGRIASLAGIRDDGTHLEIGSMTRHRDVETSPLVRAEAPLVAAALSYVGHVTVRNRGTVGGSVANADPAAELPAVLRGLDGEVVATGPGGQRRIPAAEFFLGRGVTALSPDEVLTALRVPKQEPGTTVSVQEFSRRHRGWAVVAVFGTARLGADGSVSSVRLALAGVGEVPFRADVAEELLTGQVPTPELLRAVGDAVSAAVSPVDDLHAPAQYRRHLAGVLTRRCLTDLTSERKERS